MTGVKNVQNDLETELPVCLTNEYQPSGAEVKKGRLIGS